MKKMGKPCVVWIESDAPADGAKFLNGLRAFGWENLLTHLEPGGVGRSDKAHSGLPIRAFNGQFLIRPDYEDYENAKLSRETIIGYHEFLAQWLFSPLVDPKGSLLTATGGGDLLRAQIIGIGGHGSATLAVWGSTDPIDLAPMLNEIAADESVVRTSPAYLIIGTCSQLRRQSALLYWSKAFRQASPLHGILGYQAGYPGSKKGGLVLDKFARLLGSGKTILDAWRLAHEALDNICPTADDPSPCRERWAAILHEEAQADTLGSIANSNRQLDPNKEIYYFDYRDFAKDKKKKLAPLPDRNLPPVPIDAKFKIDNVEVTPEKQRSHPLVSHPQRLGSSPTPLVPPSAVVVSLKSRAIEDVSLRFLKGDKLRIIFNLYRENKAGLDITKLFDIGRSDSVNRALHGKSWQPLKPLVGERSKHFPFPWQDYPAFKEYDALEVTLPCDGADDGTRFDIHLVLNTSDVILKPSGHYLRGGRLNDQYDHYGYFWMRVVPPRAFVDILQGMENEWFETDYDVEEDAVGWSLAFPTRGVWLAGPMVRKGRE